MAALESVKSTPMSEALKKKRKPEIASNAQTVLYSSHSRAHIKATWLVDWGSDLAKPGR